MTISVLGLTRITAAIIIPLESAINHCRKVGGHVLAERSGTYWYLKMIGNNAATIHAQAAYAGR
jgi:hypothetical protein